MERLQNFFNSKFVIRTKSTSAKRVLAESPPLQNGFGQDDRGPVSMALGFGTVRYGSCVVMRMS